MPSPDAIILPEVSTVAIRLDQVQTFINSMVLIKTSEELSGLNPWVYETAAALTEDQREQHNLVIIGFHYSIVPTRYWKDFPTFLAHLESRDPIALRDQVLDFYLGYKPSEAVEKAIDATKESLLADLDFFLDYLRSKFAEESIDIKIESRAFELLNEPSQMKNEIVTHLRFMWEEYYQAEWDRIRPMLADAVMAFEEIDFSGMSRAETVKYITGKDTIGCIEETLKENVHNLVFVPSAHNGPYLGRFQYKNTEGIIFGARLPKDTEIHAPDLSRNDITIRLSALADDLRLQILKLLAEEGEMKSQEVMERLELSQSAASRQLNQLSATGYLNSRRCSGAKCYSLNSERIQDTLRAVGAFLLCE